MVYVILCIRFNSVFFYIIDTIVALDSVLGIICAFGVVNVVIFYNRSQMLILSLSAHLHVLYTLQFDLMLFTYFFPFITFSPPSV